MHFVRYATAAIVLFAAMEASAQDDFLISCDGAPPQAVLQLPEPLSNWGKVYCTKYGHTLAAKERWIWSYPGAFAPVHLPAQMVREQPKEVGHAAFFKKIELAPLTGRHAEVAAERINGKLGTKSDSSVSSAYRLALTNQDGDSHVVLFAITAHEVEVRKGHWGFWCEKECKDGAPFMLLNYEGQKQ